MPPDPRDPNNPALPAPAAAAANPVATSAPVVADAAAANPAATPAPLAPPATPAAPAPIAAEPAPAEPKPPVPEPTLLQKFDDTKKPADDAKAADAKVAKPDAPAAELPKPGEEPKPADAAAVEPPKPVEYKYTLPETLKMDDALKSDVHKALDEFRTNPAEGAQHLIDLHAKAMANFAEQTLAEQHRVFNEYRAQNVKAVMADSEIGGAGHQTAMGAIARMRNLVGGEMLNPRTTADGKQMISEMDEFLQTTGAGDHPVFLKMLHRFARYFDEGQTVIADGRPTKNNGSRPRSGLYTEASRAKMQV